MKAWKVLETKTQQNLIVLFISGLLFWISITLLLPVLPAYIQDVGATTQQIGIIMGCFAIGLLCSRTLLGQVADRRSRKLVILIGTIVAAVAPIGYLFIQSISGLAAIRAFHGISIAAFTIGYSALVVDLSPRQQRGELIGYMNLAVPTGMSIGPALGGWLQTIDYQAIALSSGYQVIFLTSAACGLLALSLSSQIQDSTPNQDQSPRNLDTNGINRDFWQLSREPALLIPTIVLLLIGLVFGTLVAFLPLYVRELNLGFNVGLFYTGTAIASFTVRLFVGQASDRYGRGLFISSSLVCYLVSMAVLAKAETSISLMLAALIEGAGAGILIPLILALISDRSYANERGKVFALCMGGFDVGIALAGPILGSLAFILGYRGIFSLAAILAAIALTVFITSAGKNLRHSLYFALGKAKDAYILDFGDS